MVEMGFDVLMCKFHAHSTVPHPFVAPPLRS
jgi:hypothetical protein